MYGILTMTRELHILHDSSVSRDSVTGRLSLSFWKHLSLTECAIYKLDYSEGLPVIAVIFVEPYFFDRLCQCCKRPG